MLIDPSDFLEAGRTVATWVAAICAIYVAWRASNWRGADRQTAAEKAMEQRVSNLEQEVIAMDLKELPVRVAALERSVISIETRMDSMPSKSDVEAIRSDLRGVEKSNARTEAMVTQIHNYLLTQPGGAR